MVRLDFEPMVRQGSASAQSAKRRRSKALPLITVCGISLCYFLISIYEGGDLIGYQSYFSNVKQRSILEGYLFYRSILGASEPVYYLLTWYISNLGVDYLVFKVAIASCLYIVLSTTLLRFSIPLPSILLFCSTNFYLLALYSELERLSVAMIFFLLALRSKSQGKLFWTTLFCGLALGSHLQITILLFAIILGYQVESIALRRDWMKIRINSLLKQVLALSLVLASVVAFLASAAGETFFATINHKIEYYSGSSSMLSLLQAALLFPLMFLLSKNRLRDTVVYAIISCFIFVFGGDRLNIFLAMLVLILAYTNNRWRHPLALVAHTYFTVKGLNFMFLVITTGRGYG